VIGRGEGTATSGRKAGFLFEMKLDAHQPDFVTIFGKAKISPKPWNFGDVNPRLKPRVTKPVIPMGRGGVKGLRLRVGKRDSF